MLAGRVRNCENADSAVLRWPELGVVVGRRGAATSSREGFKSVCVLGAWRRQVGSAEAEGETSRTGWYTREPEGRDVMMDGQVAGSSRFRKTDQLSFMCFKNVYNHHFLKTALLRHTFTCRTIHLDCNYIVIII